MKARLLLAFVTAACALAGCASNGPPPAEVTRFHAAQPIARGDISIEPLMPGPGNDSLAFQTYAAAIAPELERAGFRVVPAGTASLVAAVDVRQQTREGPPRGPRFSIGIGGASFGRHTGVGAGTSIGLGGNRASYVTGTELAVQIRPRGGGTALWEGRARTQAGDRSPYGQPAQAVARLANALFAGFPGESGRTITVR